MHHSEARNAGQQGEKFRTAGREKAKAEALEMIE